MECKVSWVASSGMGFLAETGSGHAVMMDGAPDGGVMLHQRVLRGIGRGVLVPLVGGDALSYSIAAASITERGIDCRPARKNRKL